MINTSKKLLGLIGRSDLRILSSHRIGISRKITFCSGGCALSAKCLSRRLGCSDKWGDSIIVGVSGLIPSCFREDRFPKELNLTRIEDWEEVVYRRYLEKILETYD
ncbi:MAG: hypothetical protein J6I84_02850 [Bacilli bacterium]|nr:hypothetical protein [Bacilli bacterium]